MSLLAGTWIERALQDSAARRGLNWPAPHYHASVPDYEPAVIVTLIYLAILERAMGIEPIYSAWKAAALPLCDAREYVPIDTPQHVV